MVSSDMAGIGAETGNSGLELDLETYEEPVSSQRRPLWRSVGEKIV